MYSKCLFCNHELGRNEALDDFPVGCRLAFDPGKGRLRQILLAGGGLGAFGVIITGFVPAVPLMLFGSAFYGGMNAIVNGRSEQVVARIRTDTAGTIAVRRRHLAESRLVRGADASLGIDLRCKHG